MLRCSDLPVAITFSTCGRIALELIRGNVRDVEAVALKLRRFSPLLASLTLVSASCAAFSSGIVTPRQHGRLTWCHGHGCLVWRYACLHFTSRHPQEALHISIRSTAES